MEYLDQFVSFISAYPPALIYLVLFLVAFFENLIPPIPGDSIIVLGAYLAGRGVLNEAEVFIWMWLGSFSGCMFVYAVGYRKGRAFFVARSPRIFSPERFAQAERWFDRYGGKLIVFNRFLPGVRCVIGISAGIGGVKPMRMALYMTLGTLIWNGLLVYTGILVGSNWKLILRILKTYNRVLMVLFILAAGGGAAVWYRHRRRGGKDAGDGREDGHEDRRADGRHIG
ncbi:MAG: DedA family protein [Candidatus Latescibacteria bacterium]|nr:DedA family protein [Candidatus Latescibacterota bacterium]